MIGYDNAAAKSTNKNSLSSKGDSEGRIQVGQQYILRIRVGQSSIAVRAEAVSSAQGVFFEQGGLRFRGIDRDDLMRWYDFVAQKRRPTRGRVDLARVNLVRRPPVDRPSVSGIG